MATTTVNPATGSRLPPSTPALRHRFHLLDALRGIAAISVPFWHMPPRLHGHGSGSIYLAVDFFFCLSGFIVAFSYERRLEQGTMSLWGFLRARIIRLYPMYLLGAILGAVAFYREFGIYNWRIWPGQFAMIPAFFVRLPETRTGIFPFNGSAWSIFYEVVANVVYATTCLLRRQWIAPLAITLALCGMLTIHYAHGSLDDGWGTTSRHFAIGLGRALLSFNLGVLLKRLHRHTGPALHGRGAVTASVAICVALLLVLFSPFHPLDAPWFHKLALLAVFPAMILLGAKISVPRALENGCAFLGDVSYPLYLLSWPILFLTLYRVDAQRLSRAEANGLIALVVAGSIAVSYLVARQVDEPIRAFLRERF